jgi:hypothetical protein
MTTPSPPDTPPSNDPDTTSATPATVEEQAVAALDAVDQIAGMLEDLVTRFTAVENVLGGLQRGGGAPENRTDFRFESYPKAATAKDQAAQVSRVRKAWERLDTWVTWLVGTYRLTNIIPPCWADHPAIREELIGLRVAWTGAWSAKATNEAIVIWHEKLRTATRDRLLDGNWGSPRCDGRHDDSGLDLAESHRAWVADQRRDHALITARDRALATVRTNWPTGDDPS